MGRTPAPPSARRKATEIVVSSDTNLAYRRPRFNARAGADLAFSVVAFLFLITVATGVLAQSSNLRLDRIAGGLTSPLYVTPASA
jgi:hypothetical protein